jgi:predicted GIY-YIG superfamily endonuclease
MRQWFPENKVIANSMALTPEKFYIYKISLDTGHFYIGQTGDLSTRLAHHISCIAYEHHDHTGNRLFFQVKAAELLCERFENEIQNIKDIKKFITVHIIGIVDSRKYALALEEMAINDNLSNPFCLNR